MATKKSKAPDWPRDHAAKHAQAARLGWERKRRKFGGGAEHTEKMRYLKPRKAKAAKPKAAPAATPKKPAEDTFQYVATQKASGKWVVNKVYKSGKVVVSPKEYDRNPIPQKAYKQQRSNDGQGSLFGGTYDKGLFG